MNRHQRQCKQAANDVSKADKANKAHVVDKANDADKADEDGKLIIYLNFLPFKCQLYMAILHFRQNC